MPWIKRSIMIGCVGLLPLGCEKRVVQTRGVYSPQQVQDMEQDPVEKPIFKLLDPITTKKKTAQQGWTDQE